MEIVSCQSPYPINLYLSQKLYLLTLHPVLKFEPILIALVSQGSTWQQAVQWMPEVEVHAGSQASLLTQHDTYGINFAWSSPSDCTSVNHDSIDSKVTSNKACNSRSSCALNGHIDVHRTAVQTMVVNKAMMSAAAAIRQQELP